MRRLVIVASLIAGLLLIACNGGDEEAGPAATPAATQAPTPPSTEGGPPPITGESRVTESGLEIIDVQVGEGDEAETGKTAVVHYTVWLPDGSKLDSSVDRDQPFAFPLGAGQVIRGWDEGVVGMKVGGKRRLVVPPELAYGEEGRPPRVPPNAELTFDIELLEVR